LVSLYLQDPDVTLHLGDCLEVLRTLPDGSVDCVVTSPPYWGLRDYGTEGQLGLEPTPEQYVEKMVEVFREVRRVLAAHGTVWLNLGDSYVNNHPNPNNDPGRWERSTLAGIGSPRYLATLRDGTARTVPKVVQGLKNKDLVGIPWRVAFALQADGWYLRSDIIWAKPNPMPESVTDRPTKAHEYVFLLSKQARYFFDQEAVREKWADARLGLSYPNGAPKQQTTKGNPDRNDGGHTSSARRGLTGAAGPDGRRKTTVHGADGSIQHRNGERWPNSGRNIRSVWEIATQPYPEAHFATFPEELARRCIAAGCPEDGVVLDTFVGSGTVCFVARKLGRHSIGIDLSESYLELAARRLQQQSLFATEATLPA
jgi:DNA modification methylase